MVQKNMKKKTDKKTDSKEPPARNARAKHIAPQSAGVRRTPLYRINRRFPESNNTSRQLQLLLAGSMPLLRQKVSGAAYRLRSFFSTLALKTKTRQAPSGHRFVQTAVFLTAGLLLTVFAANRVLYTTATTLSFEGKELGTVAGVLYHRPGLPGRSGGGGRPGGGPQPVPAGGGARLRPVR